MDKDYQQYSIEDFVNDFSFQIWVLVPDSLEGLAWEDWIKNNPHKRNEVEKAKSIVQKESKNYKLTKKENEEILRNVLTQIHEIEEDPFKKDKIQRQIKKLDKSYFFKFRRAAVFALIILLSFISIYKINFFNFNSYATQKGETKSIKLPDDSKIILKANSSLSFYENWNGKIEKLRFDGEGFFKVKNEGKTDNEPLWIKTKGLKLEVTGTKFYLDSRSNQKRIAVKEGQIKLYKPSDHKSEIGMVKSGEKVIYANGNLSNTQFSVIKNCTALNH